MDARTEGAYQQRIAELTAQLAQRATTTATCTQQQRSVFEGLHQTIRNHFAGRPMPSRFAFGP